MAGLPTGTVTFLIDIEGSTRLLERLGARYAKVLAEYRQLLRSAFQERNGQEVDTQGDAFFVAFARAKDALSAAVAGQRTLAAHLWPHGAQLRVRIAALAEAEEILVSQETLGADLTRFAVSKPRKVLLKGISVPAHVVSIDWR